MSSRGNRLRTAYRVCVIVAYPGDTHDPRPSLLRRVSSGIFLHRLSGRKGFRHGRSVHGSSVESTLRHTLPRGRSRAKAGAYRFRRTPHVPRPCACAEPSRRIQEAQEVCHAHRLRKDLRAPGTRQAFLMSSLAAIVQARSTRGCRDFVVAADPIEPDRVNVYEAWESEEALVTFRGAGPEQTCRSIVRADVSRHVVLSSGPA